VPVALFHLLPLVLGLQLCPPLTLTVEAGPALLVGLALNLEGTGSCPGGAPGLLLLLEGERVRLLIRALGIAVAVHRASSSSGAGQLSDRDSTRV
jgi:hypothetical protein